MIGKYALKRAEHREGLNCAANLDPGIIIDLDQSQALTSTLKSEVHAMLWEVEDEIMIEHSLYAAGNVTHPPT